MQRYEYKVVPAPEKGLKTKGVKPGAPRFAHTLENLMNGLGAEGWEYIRADTLPCTERAGLTGSQTIYRNVLIFRRGLESDTGETAETAPDPILIEAMPDPEPDHAGETAEPDATPDSPREDSIAAQ
ncbi:DUF4177 domain-containing protein [Rhodophyticola porphyridii]|uniref:DUF4177 domain-containing protein n=1 Tax=Rhodophyticola porphyridii TaxID=1852017 RepID=UPI0035CFED49